MRRGVVGEQIAEIWKVERGTQGENGRKEGVDTGGKGELEGLRRGEKEGEGRGREESREIDN